MVAVSGIWIWRTQPAIGQARPGGRRGRGGEMLGVAVVGSCTGGLPTRAAPDPTGARMRHALLGRFVSRISQNARAPPPSDSVLSSESAHSSSLLAPLLAPLSPPPHQSLLSSRALCVRRGQHSVTARISRGALDSRAVVNSITHNSRTDHFRLADSTPNTRQLPALLSSLLHAAS